MTSWLIVNYKTPDFVVLICQELSKVYGSKKPYEVLIADNSGDLSLEHEADIQSVVGQVKLFKNGNIGFGRAINLLVNESRGDTIVSLNPDISWKEDSFMMLAKKFDDDIGNSLCLDKNSRADSYLYVGDRVVYINSRPADLAQPFVGFWFFAIKKNIFLSLSGFDERFFLYAEDLDFFVRYCAKLGCDSVDYIDSDLMHHSGGSSVAFYSRIRRFYFSFVNNMKFLRKHAGNVHVISAVRFESKLVNAALLAFPRALKIWN